MICSREEVGPTLSQALHLLNGETIENKITQGGVVKKLMSSNRTPREIASELFLRCFGRFPTDNELIKLEKYWGVTEEQPMSNPLSEALVPVLDMAPVIPVIRIEEPGSAVPLAAALAEGGLRVLEITLPKIEKARKRAIKVD